MRLLISILTTIALVICYTAPPALADWDPNNPVDLASVKMHFPQLPDPNGWDVEILSLDIQHEIADDWLCTETGSVTDIHFWTSWYADDVALNLIDSMVVTIYSNDLTGPYSKPGVQLWTRTFGRDDYTMIPYGTGLQGWCDPQQDPPWNFEPGNHNLFQQVNIKYIQDPFIQQEGEVYWVGIYVYWLSGPHNPVGWKTADVEQYPPPYTGTHYMDDAVYRDLQTYEWLELKDPGQVSLDLAFVITNAEVIPTLNQWGLIALVLVLLAAGTVFVLRRRRARVV